ncbi:MAG TPA: MMPL family transporter [Actinocrinis sp.]|nr:MMPL family transporter [Actinocrinis sp.]
MSAGSSYSSDFSLPHTDSAKAYALMAQAFPAQSGDTATMVWHVGSGTVRAQPVESRMSATLTSIGHLSDVAAVSNPYTSAPSQISADGKTAYAKIELADSGKQLSGAQVHALIDTAQKASTKTLQVELGGGAIQSTEQSPASDSEIVGIIAAAVVLFLAFGSLFAMALPILTGVAGVGGGLLAVGLLTHATPIADFAPSLGALIGLGVGIDYALFIVTRFRCALRSGQDVREAVGTAVNTSGRAVLFAGGTVCIALLGMLVLNVSFLNGVALAAAITVGSTVLAALTLLPAMLGVLGPRVFSRRERRRIAAGELPQAAHGTEDKHGRWRRWAGSVERRPRLMSLVALVMMGVLAIPTLGLRLGAADAGNDPASTTTRKAYDLLAEGFGAGFNGPLVLVAEAPSSADKAAVDHLAAAVEKEPGVAHVSAPQVSADGKVELVEVMSASSPESKQTTELIDHLRADTIPKAEAGTGLNVYVGGGTATYADFASVLSGKLPLFVGLIVALGFVLLVIAFRCLLVPLTAALMNLLAAAASLGVVTAFFEWGWGSDTLGMGRAGPVEAFVPVMMLAILFGLSMDYQVFLVSRMHEDWVHHRDNARAVKIGQVETSRVITIAATIMISVFCTFAFGSARIIGEFGIGLATAVALDAFVLRTVLVPAVMHVFGRANWWLPAWLDRFLPHLHVEPPEIEEAASPVPAPTPTPAPGPGATRPLPIPGPRPAVSRVSAY